jgi:transcriptional regulator with XRE-family HTH domain
MAGGDEANMMRKAEWYAEMTRNREKDTGFQLEYFKLVFTEELGRLLEQRGISQAELARRLDTSRAYITRIFRTDFNPTVETMLKLAIALDADLSVHMHPRETEVRWLEIPKAPEIAIPGNWNAGSMTTAVKLATNWIWNSESTAAA